MTEKLKLHEPTSPESFTVRLLLRLVELSRRLRASLPVGDVWCKLCHTLRLKPVAKAHRFLTLSLFGVILLVTPSSVLKEVEDEDVINAIKTLGEITHFVNTPTLVQWTGTASTTGVGAGSEWGDAAKAGDDVISQLDFYLPNPCLQGNFLVCAISVVDVASITVTDESGTAWTQIGSTAVDAGNDQLSLWCRANAPAGIRGITAKLATPSGNAYLQAQASEWYNITTTSPSDGSARTSTAIAAGTATWATDAFSTVSDGDLVIAFFMSSGATPWLGNSWTAGSGFTLITADIADGMCCEYQIQTTHGSITPSVVANPTTSRALGVTAAFKSAAAGTAPNNSVYVKGLLHQSLNAPASGFTVQFPCTGNCIAVVCETGTGSGGGKVTAITDTIPNSYTKAVEQTETGGTNTFTSTQFLASGTTSGNLVLTFTTDATLFRSRFLCYDIANAATSQVGAATVQNAGLHNTSTYLTSVTLHPTGANNLILAHLLVEIGTNYGVWGFNTYFDCPSFPQQDDGLHNGTIDNHLARDDANAHYYTANTSPVPFTWASTASYQAGSGQWASTALEIISANPATAQPFSPLIPSVVTITLNGLVGTVYHGVYTCPARTTKVTMGCQGAGGAGARGTSTAGAAGKGGGKGGDCSVDSTVAVQDGARIIYRIGGGGTNTAGVIYNPCSTILMDTDGNLLEAKSGYAAADNSNGGSTTSSSGFDLVSGNVGEIVFTGGNGASGTVGGGGGGGGSAGSLGAGNVGAVTAGGTGGSGSPAGATGGNGGASGANRPGNNGASPGAGGGGAFWVSGGAQLAGSGGAGRITVTAVPAVASVFLITA